MSVHAGSRVGGYEIISPIGAGGMGEVYRAHDPRLRRDVAIKFLSDQSSLDPTLVSRFQIEAQATSALNHPHILTIFDVGSAAVEGRERSYIVMEYVEGMTLRSAMQRGVDVEELLAALIEVADGLAKAHEAGIIHRDLKPENVMITADGYAKILDFGLAKLLRPQGTSDTDSTVQMNSVAGLIVGTAAYMSPEQIRGEDLDPRSDVFAFGCILYEIAAGKHPFVGPSASETLQRILIAEPPPLQLSGPGGRDLQRIVRKCLRNDRNARYASMRDVGNDLRARRDRMRRGVAPRAVRIEQLTFARATEEFPALSPAGTQLVFSRDTGKIRKLFLLDRESGVERRVATGESDEIQPAWTPDGSAIAFVRATEPGVRLEPGDVFGAYVGANIWRVDLATGRETLLLREAFNPDYSPDGESLAFDCSWSGARRIWTAGFRGQNPQERTADTSQAISHLRPRWSPDGKRIVFQNMEGTRFDIRVVDLASKEIVDVTNDVFVDLQPVWSHSGDAVLFSSYRGGGINIWRREIDDRGVPDGPLEQLTTGAGQDVHLDDPRSANALVFAMMRQNAEIWMLPVDPSTGMPTGSPEQVVATSRETSRGAWSPDGARIAFNSDRNGAMNLWLHDIAEGSLRPLTRGPGGDFQPNWSPDGRELAFFSGRAGTLDIWRLELASGELTRLTNGEGININPFYSPDGSMIAFQSDRDGRLEVWLMDRDGSNVRQLTTIGVGGHFLRWRRDGAGIYFRCPDGVPATMFVPVSGDAPVPTATVIGGSHMSLSPDDSLVMDVVGHRTLWVSPLGGGEPRKVFEFGDGDTRIDYPVWSPDGRAILFDRFTPQGSDVWMLEMIEG